MLMLPGVVHAADVFGGSRADFALAAEGFDGPAQDGDDTSACFRVTATVVHVADKSRRRVRAARGPGLDCERTRESRSPHCRILLCSGHPRSAHGLDQAACINQSFDFNKKIQKIQETGKALAVALLVALTPAPSSAQDAAADMVSCGSSAPGGAQQNGTLAVTGGKNAALSAATMRSDLRAGDQGGKKKDSGSGPSPEEVVFSDNPSRPSRIAQIKGIAQIQVSSVEEMTEKGLPVETAEALVEASQYTVRISNVQRKVKKMSKDEPIIAGIVASGVVINAETDSRGCYALVAQHAVARRRRYYENPNNRQDRSLTQDSKHTEKTTDADYRTDPIGDRVDVDIKGRENGVMVDKKVKGTVIACNGGGTGGAASTDVCVVRLSRHAELGGVNLASNNLGLGTHDSSSQLISLGFPTEFNSTFNESTQKLEATPQLILMADPGCSELGDNGLKGVSTNCHGRGGFSGGPVFKNQEGKLVLAGILVAGDAGTIASRTTEPRKSAYTHGIFAQVNETETIGGMRAFIEFAIDRDLLEGNMKQCQ